MQGDGAGAETDSEGVVVDSHRGHCPARLRERQINRFLLVVLVPEGDRRVLLNKIRYVQKCLGPGAHHHGIGRRGHRTLIVIQRGPLRMAATEEAIRLGQIVCKGERGHWRRITLLQRAL